MKRLRLSLVIAVVTALFLPMVVRAQRAAQPSWPKREGLYVATSSETIPPFARALSGYRPTGNKDYWDRPFALHGSIRIFQDNSWNGIPDFPHTMNHCSDGVFMIRWRSANPDVRIASVLSGSGDGRPYMAPGRAEKGGQFGYMYASNCEEPMFKFAATLNGNTSNLVDIYYELKFW